MTPKIGVHYQHRYGGLYLVKDIAASTVDKTRWVVYTHVYPFEYQTWIRPYDEWCDGRFKEITNEEYDNLLRKDRLEFQLEIGKARANAR